MQEAQNFSSSSILKNPYKMVWGLMDAFTKVDCLSLIESSFIMICYVYLMYYTGLNLLKRNKYYINLSHNLLKWILVGVINNSLPLLNILFRYLSLSRVIVLILIGLIAYPSKKLQRLHLSLSLRSRDKKLEKQKQDPIGSGLSLTQNFLNLTAEISLNIAILVVKLIHPDSRTPTVQARVIQIFDTIIKRRYFLQLAEGSPNAQPMKTSRVPINLTLSSVVAAPLTKLEQSNSPDDPLQNYSPFISPSGSLPETPQQQSKRSNYFDCTQVIQITQKRYDYFRRVQICYLPSTNQIDFFVLENNLRELRELEQVKVVNNLTLELVNKTKGKFIQFDSPSDLEQFLQPMVEESNDNNSSD